MASRQSLLLLLALGLATPAAGQASPASDRAPAASSQPPAASTNAARGEAVCATQADKNGLTGAGRDTFLRECTAGERLDQQKPAGAKP
ncbi:hypothetical protein [Methylobacterium sp. 37f]|uniref:hypothetical protein n=1 Tax=Methylobacterium sp. 37f TaxID=2817058 RepID=UPI001FFD24AC|nr:hypothetical protein [Methylobacterium sp. 37f]MCK2053731.1 hypothetical protein [Methylobacterium sp. 37f]